MRVRTAVACLVILLAACGRANAWGCEGHRAIVFMAERLVSAQVLAAVKATLAASPIAPALSRFCDAVPDDPIADSSTWADDYRSVEPATYGWHFINVPRAVVLTVANEPRYCRRGDCVVDAIAGQFDAFISSTDATVRGDALRFLLHFVADLHQPLHATTNGDRGGNCVPVTFAGRAPQQNQNGDFTPNLHALWDTSLIRRLMTNREIGDPRALAAYVVKRQPFPSAAAPQTPTRARVTRWAQEAHDVGKTLVYPRLPVPVGFEPASAFALTSCADNHDVAHRMLAKHEVIGSAYEQASEPAILSQLRMSAIRLAAVLTAAYR